MASKASYYGDFNFGNFFFNVYHPMKPLRLSMVHDLIISYGMYKFLNYKYPKKSPKDQFLNYHNCNFIQGLINKNISHKKIIYNDIKTYFPNKNFKDCPIFIGIMEYCEKYSGSSLNAALDLTERKANIAINWNGGLHHARTDLVSGFCYTNDIVLAILELLKVFSRVLYIDIDVHHGDGVEEAFYLSNRVFTLSFHFFEKFFFPETGAISNKGIAEGEYYSANIPLKNGLSDESFEYIFKPVVGEILKKFIPNVIVLQSGADSLGGDKLGNFNLTFFGHGNCIKYLMNFKIPMLILGGGGYTIENVAKCWTIETSIIINKKISCKMPYNNFSEFFSSLEILNVKKTEFIDKNNKKDLKQLKKKIIKNIKNIKNF
jgi:acetoin utilization deacetylase AcuC-like enzyme